MGLPGTLQGEGRTTPPLRGTPPGEGNGWSDAIPLLRKGVRRSLTGWYAPPPPQKRSLSE